jgi:hypothetical protein
MGKSLEEIWRKIENRVSEDRRLKKEIIDLEYKRISESYKNIRENILLNQSSSGFRASLPDDFLAISSIKKIGINSPYIIYKHKTGYGTLDLSQYVSGITINNTNEIVRFGQNDLFVIGNWNTTPGPIAISLLNCRLIGDKLIPGEVKWKLISEITGGVHGSDYDKVNGYIYMSNYISSYTIGFTVGRINPRNLDDYQTYKFANSGQFRYPPNDVICRNGYAYLLYGSNGGAVVRFGPGTLTPTTLYTLSSPTTYAIYFGTPFDIVDNEIFYTTIYATGTTTQQRNTMGIVVLNLETGALKRRLNLQSIGSSGTSFPTAHWMEVCNGKIYVTTAGYNSNRQLLRFDAQTLLLEEVYQNDTGVSDDNIVIGDDIYICQENTSGLPTPPCLLRVNAENFNDRSIEISNLNDGYGSYGTIKKSNWK